MNDDLAHMLLALQVAIRIQSLVEGEDSVDDGHKLVLVGSDEPDQGLELPNRANLDAPQDRTFDECEQGDIWEGFILRAKRSKSEA